MSHKFVFPTDPEFEIKKCQRYSAEVKKFREEINSQLTSHKNWDITTLFYKVLHLIDSAYIYKLGKKPLSHQARERTLDQLQNRNLSKNYFKLFNMSKLSRYTPDLIKRTKISIVQDYANEIIKEIELILKSEAFSTDFLPIS